MTETYVLIPAVGAFVLAVVLFSGIMLQRLMYHYGDRKLQRGLASTEPLLAEYLVDGVPGSALLARGGCERQALIHLLLTLLPQFAGSSKDRLLALARELRLVRRSIYQTRDLSWRQREMATMHLGLMGDQAAVPVLKRLLSDPRREVRYTAARSLSLVGSSEAFEAVLKLLHMPKLVNTPRVLEIVQTMPRPDVEPLRRLVLDEKAPLSSRLVVIDLISDWREHRLVDAMEQLLHHQEPEIIIRAIKALIRIGDNECIPLILQHVDHPRWEIRNQVIRAIGEFEFREATPLVRRALCDSAYWVRRNAALALTKLATNGHPLLDPTEYPDDRFARDMVRYQLQRMGLLEVDDEPEAVAAAGGEAPAKEQN